MLKYACENGCPIDNSVCEFAIENDNLEMLKYAHKKGCPLDKWIILLAKRFNN